MTRGEAPRDQACEVIDSCDNWAAHVWKMPSGKKVKLCKEHRQKLENLGVDLVHVRELPQKVLD